MRTLLVPVLVLAGCATGAGNMPSDVPPIAWAQWSPAPFARARAEGKMILVDVGMEGCTACRYMDEFTYTHPRVRQLINEYFVAIAVDSEARPDVGQRYYPWAWPATIIMTPEGKQVMGIKGNRIPRSFLPILNQLIASQKNGTLESDAHEPGRAGPPVDEAFAALQTRIRAQLDRGFDTQAGGWGRRQRIPIYEPVSHAFFRAHVLGQKVWHERALLTLDGMSDLIDPVWGGVFVAAYGADWTNIIPEKRLAGNAGALLSFSDAYLLTGDQKWLDRALLVDKYLQDWMIGSDGAFYASQEDDAPQLPHDLGAREYYRLGDPERRRYGIPPIDHATYTDLNGRAIQAYVRFFEATGAPERLAIARRAAEVMATRQQEAGWFLQLAAGPDMGEDARMRKASFEPRAYLKPQGQIGLALLALYRATGEDIWLERATRLGSGLQTTLEDPEKGGFFGRESSGMDAFVPPHKPLEDNAVAARFLFELATYTKNDSLRDSALRAIRAVSLPDRIEESGRLIGNLALAVEMATTGTLEFSVVGERGDAAADALFEAGRSVFEPRKVLHYEKAGRYPRRETAAMYICNDHACSPPITDPAQVAAQAAQFGPES